METMNEKNYDWEQETFDITSPMMAVATIQRNGKQLRSRLWTLEYEDHKVTGQTISVNLTKQVIYANEIIKAILKRHNLIPFEKLSVLKQMLKKYIRHQYGYKQLADKENAFKLYHAVSMQLIDDARNQDVTTNRQTLTRRTLRKYQQTLQILISILHDVSIEAVKSLAPEVHMAERYTQNYLTKNKKNCTPSDSEASLFVQLSQRHFDSIATAIENAQSYYFVEQNDLGFDNVTLNGQKRNEKIAKQYRDFFDKNYIYTGHEDSEFYKNLTTKKKANARQFVKCNTALTDFKIHRYMTHLSIHFCSLLMFESGCNREQIAYLDFDQPLATGTGAQRFIAQKPRANYQKKPVWITAQFLPTWRRFREIRKQYIERYNDKYTPYGIPIWEDENSSKTSPLIELDSVKYIRTKIPFPKEADIRGSFTGRKFTTVNLLNQTSGNTALVSSIVGRADATTKRYYLEAAQIDSAKAMTNFFNSLTEFVTYKTNETSTNAPIIEGGDDIPVGHCEASDSDTPTLIDNVTEVVQNPRCGAPITCLFCKHFGIHGTETDIFSVLSAKKWLEIQSTNKSDSIDEHFTKYLPFNERINDILDDFKSRGESFKKAYDEAFEKIHRGIYAPYWQDKINALLATEEY